MILSPLNTILFFCLAFIIFGLLILADDLIQARARKRRKQRRARVERITAYHVDKPLNRQGLTPDNVVDLDQWSRKVSA